MTARTICYGPDPAQQAELRLPLVARPPVVCLVHGGFWRMPYGRDQFDAVAADLVGRGYAVWNIGYRRLGAPGGGWRGTLEDITTAVDELATLVAAGVSLDLERVTIAGHSAGGQLALWAAATCSPLRQATRVRIGAVAALAAISDLARAAALDLGRGAVAELLGGLDPVRLAAASPHALLPIGVPQLLLHGTDDMAVPIELSRDFAAAARTAGDSIELVELPGCGHMEFLDPSSAAHAALVGWLARR